MTQNTTEKDLPPTRESENEESEGIGELINIPSPAKKAKKKLLRQGSVSENFFAVQGAALILPRQSSLEQSMDAMQVKKFGGDLKNHLHAIFNLIRPQDNIKLAARLECWTEYRTRYLVIVTTIGRQDTEESIIVGMDFASRESTECTIGLVIPIWSDTIIRLDGDGGFEVAGRDRTHTFKPVSVQAMWSALQAVHKCIDNARQHNYYYGSLFLTWTCYYESRITSSRLFLNEWEYREEIWSRRANYFAEKDTERESTEQKIRGKLKEVMMKMDLDNCTSRNIREALEKVTDLDLAEYKTYIDSEMIVMLRQMDTASKILEYVYLGSEWNASNLEELKQIGITHILNITMEIDNFYPDNFIYKNVRCHDFETTDLLHAWNDTYKFIKRAHRMNGKCLVHCKMGISRSAASVSAYLMKENLWTMEKALSFVKERRAIVHPNKGFMRQLQEYEGILNASAQRHNRLFRSLSESNLSAEHPTKDDEMDGKASPEHMTPTNSVSEQVPTFDLNRRLLDLTVLPYRHDHKRPKSWSLGDAKHYCLDIQDFEKDDDFDRSHMSEPRGFFTPIQSSRSEINGSTCTHDKRKKWRRRHTEQIFTNFSIDFNARSDDSVFANPGVVPSIDAWVTVPVTPKRVERMSSPAAIQSGNLLDIEEKETKAHSSIVSPMNSPSYKCVKEVDVSSLKSRFSEDAILQIEEQETVQSTSQDLYPTVGVVVAMIESPVEYVPLAEDGQQEKNEKEIPPAGRERSFSENQAYVKNIVSEIESRYSTQGSTSSCASDGFPGQENTEALVPLGVARSQSLPSRCKKPSMSPPLQILPVIEDKQTDSSPSRCLDKNMNTNNNNSIEIFQEYRTTTVIEIDHETNDSNSPILKTVSQPGCSVTEKVLAEDVSLPYEAQANDFNKRNSERFVIRTLTQSELQVIREVGRTFLTELEETDSIQSSEGSVSGSLLSPSAAEVEETPCIKRGIVRRMARLIENNMKQQEESNTPSRSPSVDPTAASSHSTTVMNKLLMGEPVHQQPESESLPSHFFEEVMSCPVPLGSVPSATAATLHDSTSTSSLKDLISLVGPTPYRPLHATLYSNARDPMEEESSPRYKKRPTGGIRRTQSERSVIHPIKMLFRDAKWRSKEGLELRRTKASKSHPELSADCCQGADSRRFMVRPRNSDTAISSTAVKEIVHNIENSFKNIELTMRRPVDEETREWSSGDRPPSEISMHGNVLRRSNSSPHINQDRVKRSVLGTRIPFRSSPKTRVRKKTSHRQFQPLNALYQTM